MVSNAGLLSKYHISLSLKRERRELVVAFDYKEKTREKGFQKIIMESVPED
jgi:hypothetical protein